ncbi:MAG: putative DNA binding domain-containing protein [Bacteroidales bacterium]|nr:putative DNA binding domain-containing protein [Candidatus Colicola caccequi]MBQ0154658.1 putative DNA binding domain-containing protein [Candidatus Colicola equi]
MNYIELSKLISSDESRVLELKKTTGELKDAMHTACAFLNTDGGWLIFGVAPASLKVVGQQVTDNTQREIAQALSGLEPAIDVQVEYIDVPDAKAGEKVIAMHFDGWVWGSNPYTYHGCPYYRVESTTKQMPREMYDERLRASKPDYFAWERQIADEVTIDDLDENRIRGAVRLGIEQGRLSPTANGEPVQTLLERFNLYKGGKLTNAAVMLFGKDTSEYPQLLLRMARFVGTDKMEFLDNQRAKGNFFDLLDAGMMFAYKHLNISGKITGLQREDKLEIPLRAMREALVNALCHRSYDLPSQSLGIAIYDDRVEIENPGRLPEGLTAENIKNSHKSQPHNQLIAEVLYKTSWLENWGTGIHRIYDACKEQNVPEPYFNTEQGYVTIVFPRPKSNGFGENRGENLARIDENKNTYQLTEIQRLIIGAISMDGHVTAKSLARMLNVSQRKMEREISSLRRNGIIDKTGKTQDGVWVVL